MFNIDTLGIRRRTLANPFAVVFASGSFNFQDFLKSDISRVWETKGFSFVLLLEIVRNVSDFGIIPTERFYLISCARKA